MSVWDNQQETEIGWFVAILEGEGSFRDEYKHKRQVRISNTNLEVISRCEQFLKRNSICYSIHPNYRLNRKPIFDISITGWEAKRLYYYIEHHLECRNDEYQLILGSPQSIREPSVDLDWLIGIFEAEGYFSLTINKRGYAALSIGMSNTNRRIISKTVLNLRRIDVLYYIQNTTKYNKKPHYKESQQIAIVGLLRCEKFLRETKNKWKLSVSKRKSELMREFVNSRLAVSQTQSLSARQLQIIETVKDLNR
jgi:hypothetical protein